MYLKTVLYCSTVQYKHGTLQKKYMYVLHTEETRWMNVRVRLALEAQRLEEENEVRGTSSFMREYGTQNYVQQSQLNTYSTLFPSFATYRWSTYWTEFGKYPNVSHKSKNQWRKFTFSPALQQTFITSMNKGAIYNRTCSRMLSIAAECSWLQLFLP